MIEQPPFRAAWLGTWPLGVIDFTLHALAAWLLPGTWWWQWLPDAMLPLLWSHGMVTNRMATDRSFLLFLHRLLHVRPPNVAEGLCLWAMVAWLVSPWLGLHVAVHVAIDRLTHDRRWQ